MGRFVCGQIWNIPLRNVVATKTKLDTFQFLERPYNKQNLHDILCRNFNNFDVAEKEKKVNYFDVIDQ